MLIKTNVMSKITQNCNFNFDRPLQHHNHKMPWSISMISVSTDRRHPKLLLYRTKQQQFMGVHIQITRASVTLDKLSRTSQSRTSHWVILLM